MIIRTSRGKDLQVNWIWGPQDGRRKVMAETDDARPLAEICQDFDGLEWIKAYKNEEKTSYEAYEGYTKLVSAARNEETGAVVLSMSRG